MYFYFILIGKPIVNLLTPLCPPAFPPSTHFLSSFLFVFLNSLPCYHNIRPPFFLRKKRFASRFSALLWMCLLSEDAKAVSSPFSPYQPTKKNCTKTIAKILFWLLARFGLNRALGGLGAILTSGKDGKTQQNSSKTFDLSRN